MISYAQNFEDVILARLFAGRTQGFYVDVGAHHPERDSVTRHFSGLGWHGINIEPGRDFPELVRQRPRDINLNLVVTDRNGMVDFYEGESAGLASMAPCVPEAAALHDGVRRCRRVPARTLQSILDEHAAGRTIDFLSVDVEGFERQVLIGNDWQRHRPRVVVVEATLPGTQIPSHQAWEPILTHAGYRFGYFDGLNRFYVRAEDEPLLARLGPPCVFDRFITAETARLRANNPDVAAAVRELTAERDYLARQVAALQQRLLEATAPSADAARFPRGFARWLIRRSASFLRTIA